MPPNATDEDASFCVLDPFVIAPLFSLFCADNTRIVSRSYALFVLSVALSQTQLFLLMLSFICLLFSLLFIFIVLFLRLAAKQRHAPLSAITLAMSRRGTDA
jgi:hypothetical protein